MISANPAVVAAIGLFSGYYGTLMTPMAANYNLVPATLLELSNPLCPDPGAGAYGGGDAGGQ